MHSDPGGQAASIVVNRAVADDLDALARLFDAYRCFYGQASNPAAARGFLRERMQGNESVILLARDVRDGTTPGFMQLYPSFSSVVARRIWILNDLFVAPEARRRGVARTLMDAARAFAAETHAVRLVLETGEDNRAAQALYESLGYAREGGMRHYTLQLA